MLAGRAERFEVGVRRTDGERVDLRITGVPIVVAGRVVGAYDLLEDVTTANRVRRELERATEAKSLFLANMSHEIRTPLTAMIAAAELLDETGLTPLQHELGARIGRAGDRLQALIDSILDFSAIEAGATQLSWASFDPRDLLSDAATEGRRAARQRRLDFELRIEPSLPTAMTGDAHRVLQVVMNLVENAVKFTDAGSVVLSAAAAGDDPAAVEFAVTDTGIGLAPEERDAVFESFHQADPTLTRRYGGSGLGLAISKNLVELMDGRIWVESEPGRGSTFAFRIPAHLTPAAG
jgi:signal transduction histidine kinase